MNMVELTILVPVYNEKDSISRFVLEMNKFLAISPLKTSVLFVNDGSIDDSLNLIIQTVLNDSRYSYISLNENKGLSTAIKAGIDFIESPYLGYIDADLQTSPMDFILFFDHLKEYDLINGIRTHRHDSIIKKLTSKIANGVRRTVIRDGIADTCCPLKIMHTESAKRISFFNGMHRFIPALIQLQGGRVKQIEVQHFDRMEGKSKYNFRNRLIGPFFDMLAFVWMKKRNISYVIKKSSIENINQVR